MSKANKQSSNRRLVDNIFWKKEVLNDFSTIIVAGGIFLLCVVVALTVWCIRREQDEEAENWEAQVVALLRSYEQEWTSETAADWSMRKTYPSEVSVPYALYEAPRFDPGRKVFQIGGESIYTDDFNYRLFVDHFMVFTSAAPVSDEVLLSVAHALRRESIVLQEGGEKDVVELEDTFYNSKSKDHELRSATALSTEEKLRGDMISERSGETITIWFYNVEPPEMGVDAAKSIAQERITSLRDEILSGTKTFAEAGQEIIGDPVLSEIDPAIESNAYGSFTMYGDFSPFIDPAIAESVQNLGEGDISEVLTGKDLAESWYDAYFTVVKVDTITDGIDNFDEWLADKENEYDIIVVEI